MQRRLVAGRRRMALIVLLTRAAFQVFGPAACADTSAKPNVLIVMTDDQGLGDFSFTGNPVLKTLNEFVPISIGARQQPVVELTSGDWEGIYADNSGYVREAVGGPTGGHWNIQVEESGTYAFTLRRWPERAQVSLGEKYDESPSSPANKPDQKIIGFPTIAGARIEISGISVSATADPRSTSATVTAQLPTGRTKLKAWFVDGAGHGLCGAFFVTAARKKDGTIATPQLRSD